MTLTRPEGDCWRGICTDLVRDCISMDAGGRLTPAVIRTVSMRPAAQSVKDKGPSSLGALFYCTPDFNRLRLSSPCMGFKGLFFLVLRHCRLSGIQRSDDRRHFVVPALVFGLPKL